jgi:hypothetical protein
MDVIKWDGRVPLSDVPDIPGCWQGSPSGILSSSPRNSFH